MLPLNLHTDCEVFMTSKISVTIQAIIVVVAMIIGIATYFISKKNDTIVEQVAEAILKTQGIDIDFSPDN